MQASTLQKAWLTIIAAALAFYSAELKFCFPVKQKVARVPFEGTLRRDVNTLPIVVSRTPSSHRPHPAATSVLAIMAIVFGAARGWATRASRRRRQSVSCHRPAMHLAAHSRYWSDATISSPQTVNERSVLELPTKPPRVRFAPSPTGELHVGGARTALFNWLFAKSQGGAMILRVEDTDTARSTAESEAKILEALKWCGLTWDEGPDVGGENGPYRQSERMDAGIYDEQLDKLMAGGNAYRCFLTETELNQMRAEAERREEAFVLRSPWASASESQIQEMLDKGSPFVYRFRVPFDTEIVTNDLVLGEVTWNTDDLGGDFVIVRNSGVPMYNFGNVVDDAKMSVTHVLRGQEHLMNTPRQILVYEALGFEVPIFAHMPVILAPDRSKLSKRHGAVSVGEYRRRGYLASGLVNYLAHLGWNDGTNQEIYSTNELLNAFKMERMSKVAAVFDIEKFNWVNGNHIRLLDGMRAQELIGTELVLAGVVGEPSGDFVQKATMLLRDRIHTLAEAAGELTGMLAYPLEDFIVSGAPELENGSFRETASLLFNDADVAEQLREVGKTAEGIKRLAAVISDKRGGIKGKALLRPLRLCLTACERGPNMDILFDVMEHIDGNVLCSHVPLAKRLAALKEKLKL